MSFNVNIDMDSVETADFTPVPKGEYFVQVVEVSENETQAGDARLNLQLRIMKDATGNEKYAGRVLFDSIIAQFEETGEMRNWVLQKIKAISMSTGVTTMPINKDTYLDSVGKVKVKHREWEGEIKAEVSSWIARPAGSAPVEQSAPKVTEVDKAGNAMDVGNDDDIPF